MNSMVYRRKDDPVQIRADILAATNQQLRLSNPSGHARVAGEPVQDLFKHAIDVAFRAGVDYGRRTGL